MQPLPVARVVQRRVWLPVVLFLATCLTTLSVEGLVPGWKAGQYAWQAHGWAEGLISGLAVGLTEGCKYALPLMTILICHEAGHFFQARRHGVYASFPYFIPMPLGFIGTFGAVIAMEPRMGNRRALFDIGITGPLAGLVPTLIFCALGLRWSEVKTPAEVSGMLVSLGEPLVFKMFSAQVFGTLAEGQDVILHPVAFAGWVGLLLTALNLMPIGQLDGGHVLYCLLRRKAHFVATLLLLAAVAAVVYSGYYAWSLMLCLLLLMGPKHPPTANDEMPLGTGRTLLGWLTLAFIFIGFTPTPVIFN